MSARWIGLAAGAALLLIFALTCRPQPAGISMNPISWSESPQTITGTAPPLSEIKVRVDGDIAGQTQADAQGRWSLNVPRDLSRAEVEVEARTANGEMASAMMRSPQAEPTADPPAARRYPSEFHGGPTDRVILQHSARNAQPQAGALEVRGTGLPGTTIEVMADGAPLGEATVDPQGDWRAEFTLAKPARRITAAAKGAMAEVVWEQPEPAPPSLPNSSAPPVEARPSEHLIQPGETLSGLSARYNILMRRLCQLNRISNPDLIYAGERLRLR
jgi:hypothetical protein